MHICEEACVCTCVHVKRCVHVCVHCVKRCVCTRVHARVRARLLPFAPPRPVVCAASCTAGPGTLPRRAWCSQSLPSPPTGDTQAGFTNERSTPEPAARLQPFWTSETVTGSLTGPVCLRQAAPHPSLLLVLCTLHRLQTLLSSSWPSASRRKTSWAPYL